MGASLVKQTRSTTFRDLRSREHREQLRAIFFRDLFTSTGSPGTPGFFPSRILINWVRDPLDPWNNSMIFLVLYDRRIVPNFHEKFWNLELGTWNSMELGHWFQIFHELWATANMMDCSIKPTVADVPVLVSFHHSKKSRCRTSMFSS